ncbi:hypothetical protein Golomagni_03479 [Golovinomyces magnicellulatus]|nr:hypothetical protein Golomagni_03479 [Golovinomyces magnicellulatus]
MSTSKHGQKFEISQHGTSPGLQMASTSPPASLKDLEFVGMVGPLSRPRANSISSHNSSLSSNTHRSSTTLGTHTGYRAIKKDVRALPPWLRTYEEEEEETSAPIHTLISPLRSQTAENHQIPDNLARRVSQDGYVDTYEDAPSGINKKKPETGFFGGLKEPVKGRKWDHVRDGDPVIVQTRAPNKILPWRIYIESSSYGPSSDVEFTRVDLDFLKQQTPGYQIPWRGDLEGSKDPENHAGLSHTRKQRKTLTRRIQVRICGAICRFLLIHVQYHLIMHPLAPLLLRLIVLTTSVIALGIATSVHHLSAKYSYEQTPSSTMAIVVDVVAIPYILYITWDEYTGKPLGLRSAGAKIRLVLLDLIFIIYESANLSLAFGSLTDDNGSCESSVNGYNFVICNRVKALCGILMLALYAWSLTFAISIIRLVQRVGGKEED